MKFQSLINQTIDKYDILQYIALVYLKKISWKVFG